MGVRGDHRRPLSDLGRRIERRRRIADVVLDLGAAAITGACSPTWCSTSAAAASAAWCTTLGRRGDRRRQARRARRGASVAVPSSMHASLSRTSKATDPTASRCAALKPAGSGNAVPTGSEASD